MSDQVTVAVIAAGTSIVTTVVLRYVVDARLMRRKAEVDYEYEQRKALYAALGEFKGPLVQAAEELHQRMGNLYRNEARGWLRTGADGARGYYLSSTVYRFVALVRLAVRLEQRALYLDPGVATRDDLIALRYAKAMQSVLTDTRLFEGSGYDPARSVDHVFRESLRSIADVPLPEGRTLTYSTFASDLADDALLAGTFDFFSTLSRTTTPLRWDRLVALDLLLMCFMTRVGFDDVHRFTAAQLHDVAAQLETSTVPDNLVEWFVPAMRLGGEPEVQAMTAQVRATR